MVSGIGITKPITCLSRIVVTFQNIVITCKTTVSKKYALIGYWCTSRIRNVFYVYYRYTFFFCVIEHVIVVTKGFLLGFKKEMLREIGTMHINDTRVLHTLAIFLWYNVNITNLIHIFIKP